jgi:ferredoxin
MKVTVDRDLCSGDAVCEELCPEVFAIDDQGIAIVKVDEVPEELGDDVREAAESCPEDCIYIEDE